MNKHKDIIKLYLALINIPKNVLDNSTARFKYAVLKNTKAVEKEITLLIDVHKEKMNIITNEIIKIDSEIFETLDNKTSVKSAQYSIQGLYNVILKCGNNNTTLNDKILEITTKHENELKELDRFLSETDNDFKPFKIRLSEVPDSLDISFIDGIDILIEED